MSIVSQPKLASILTGGSPPPPPPSNIISETGNQLTDESGTNNLVTE